MGIRTEDICRKNSESKTSRHENNPVTFASLEPYCSSTYTTSGESSPVPCTSENLLPPLYLHPLRADETSQYDQQLQYVSY